MAVTSSADGATKHYDCRGLRCEVHTSSQFVTVYGAGERPVATLQRAGYFERAKGAPLWSIYATDGTKIGDTGRAGVIVSLLHLARIYLDKRALAEEIAADAADAQANGAATYGIAVSQCGGAIVTLLGFSQGMGNPSRLWQGRSVAEAEAKIAEYADAQARGTVYTIVRLPSLGADIAAPELPAPAVIESRPNTWAELTSEEQREAMERGFERGPDVRYILNKAAKPHATPRQWQLVRWTRVRPAPVETIAYAAADSTVHPVAEGSRAAQLSDAAAQAFDRTFRRGMKQEGLAVRDIRRAAFAAAISAALALMPNGASASEDRAAWAATGAAQCGFPVTMADDVTGAAHIEPYASHYRALWERHDDESPASFAQACETLRAQVKRGEFAGFTYGAAPALRQPLASLRPGQTFCHYGAPVIARTVPQDNEARPGFDFVMIEYTRADLAGELGVAVIRKGEMLDLGAACGGKGF